VGAVFFNLFKKKFGGQRRRFTYGDLGHVSGAKKYVVQEWDGRKAK
jgi:hypothetical protein